MKDGARGVQGRREDAGACATTMTDPGQRTSEKRKRPDAWTDGQESSLEDLTQQVKRLHASFEGKDGSLVVEKHEYASDMAHLEEYLHINQVLKDLHFDRLKRLEKMET